MERPCRYILLLCSVVLADVVFSDAIARRLDHGLPADAGAQFLRLDEATGSFALMLSANADLYNLPRGIRRVVVNIEGDSDASQAPADSYGDTLILVPQFSVVDGRQLPADLPAWYSEQAWIDGEVSKEGRVGLSASAVLDALLGYLGSPRRFPELQEVVLVGRGSAAEVVARHAAGPQVRTSFRVRHVGAQLAHR